MEGFGDTVVLYEGTKRLGRPLDLFDDIFAGRVLDAVAAPEGLSLDVDAVKAGLWASESAEIDDVAAWKYDAENGVLTPDWDERVRRFIAAYGARLASSGGTSGEKR